MASFSDERIAITHGDTDYLDGVATKPDGTAQPITGWTIIFTLKRNPMDADAAAVLLKSTTLATVTVTNGSGGLYAVPILPADTSGLANRDQTFFGGVVGKDPSGGVNTLWRGMVDLQATPVLTP